MGNTVYDKHYKTDDYFGKPYTELIDFFQQYKSNKTVLDLGCGQGRDSVPIAKMGYNVIAVDHSKVGIEKLLKKANAQDVKIEAYCDDIYSIEITDDIDIVLLDSMLHFYKNDLNKEKNFVNNILSNIKIGALFVNFIIKGKKREKILKEIINNSKYLFEIVTEKYVDYPDFSAVYHMIVLRKTGLK